MISVTFVVFEPPGFKKAVEGLIDQVYVVPDDPPEA
jgi:hypothetical protein